MYSCLTKKIVCDDCENKTFKFETFLSFDLNINNDNESLHTCLNRYFSTDYIYIQCENCGSKDRTVEHSVDMSIIKLPKILFIMIKRFSFNNGKPSKNNKHIDIPEELDLSQFYSTLDTTSTHYSLKSVICHKGDVLDTGHYFTLSKKYDEWCLFNDTKVTHNVCKNINSIDSSLPYILAYESK